LLQAADRATPFYSLLRSPGITPGDVIFKFKQAPHATFRRDGDDLHHDLHISLREALLGYTKTIRHLDGREVTIDVKGVTQPFQVRKMAGEGMPQHNTPSQMGVLHVKNIVDLPATLTNEQKESVGRIFPQ
jgi:DnaJ-class molecular chaperone